MVFLVSVWWLIILFRYPLSIPFNSSVPHWAFLNDTVSASYRPVYCVPNGLCTEPLVRPSTCTVRRQRPRGYTHESANRRRFQHQDRYITDRQPGRIDLWHRDASESYLDKQWRRRRWYQEQYWRYCWRCVSVISTASRVWDRP